METGGRPELSLEGLPVELKVSILTHLSGNELGRCVAQLNHEWRHLARVAVLQRAAEHRTEVVAVQRWWQARRQAALAHQASARLSAIELAVDTVERVIAPKLACLAAREQLLQHLHDHKEEEVEEGAAKGGSKGLLGALWAVLRSNNKTSGGGGDPQAPKPTVRFTRELVDALFPEQLLRDLVAPFERFLQDARPVFLRWKEEEAQLAAARAQQQKEEKQQEEKKQKRKQPPQERTKELQLFGRRMIQLLDESLAPIVAYLTYLEKEHIYNLLITPLFQGADLEADQACWAILAQHFQIPPLLVQLNEHRPWGVVEPARQRTGGAPPMGLNTFTFTAHLGWGSVITRLSMATEKLKDCTVAPHPDRNNIKQLKVLVDFFLARLNQTAVALGTSLCYD